MQALQQRLLALAQQLIERGWQPLIVSRGYKSAALHPQQVDAGMSPQQVGDEPLLMARRELCPVWVGKDRVATVRAALLAHPQCNVVLCDDGLQHYRMRRDVEIAVIDGTRGLGNGWLLPAGPLREPASRLRSVDAVVVNVQARSPHPNPLPQGEGANESLRELQFDGGHTGASEYAMRLDGTVFHNLLDPSKTATAEHFQRTSNHAVAGIGHPQRFFQHLKSLGITFTPHPFPDHHPYSATDLGFSDCDAILLTEKDAVKCSPYADARYWVLRVDAQIDASLIDLILRKIIPHGFKTA